MKSNRPHVILVWDAGGAAGCRTRFATPQPAAGSLALPLVRLDGADAPLCPDCKDRRRLIRSTHATRSAAYCRLGRVFMAFVFVQNLSTLPAGAIRMPDGFVAIRQALGLYQNWTMFAPYPEMNSAWPVIAGRLQDGTAVDVHNHRIGEPDWDKPHYVSQVYANYRWRRYLSNLEDLSDDNQPPEFGLYYGRYPCRRWNRDVLAGRHLATFEIAFNVEWSPPDNRAKDVVRRLVWSRECFG